jgi:hypothetical protein
MKMPIVSGSLTDSRASGRLEAHRRPALAKTTPCSMDRALGWVECLPISVDEGDDEQRRRDQGKPSGYCSWYSSHKIADTNNVKSNRPRCRSTDDNRCIELLVCQYMMIQYKILAQHRQGGQATKGSARRLQQEEEEHNDIHAASLSGQHNPTTAAARRTRMGEIENKPQASAPW